MDARLTVGGFCLEEIRRNTLSNTPSKNGVSYRVPQALPRVEIIVGFTITVSVGFTHFFDIIGGVTNPACKGNFRSVIRVGGRNSLFLLLPNMPIKFCELHR